ncbi:UNVERIFIED_CONTAM: hypothetical protein GTU68_031598, partial [Idotea baltica]|nr:hypothetical protein [Idotea baltica]
VEIAVDQGATFNQVSQRLVEAGFITHPLYFKLLAMYEEKTQKVKSGEYRFNKTQSPAQILDDLVQGKTMQYKLTVIEGKRFQDFYQQLQGHPKITRVIDDVDDIKVQLNIEQDRLEGLFFPDTYTFSAGTKDIDIIRQSHNLLRDFLDEEWPNRSEESFVSSPYEALILASIVEKETSVESERPVIAGVFISRLNINMPLQTDPTVIYGLGASFDGNITRKHLQTDNPYNTYTRRGLPPSPIALVGKAAILAVLHPEITGDLYFVSKNDGTHYFSKTYKEHLAAVRKYQLKR